MSAGAPVKILANKQMRVLRPDEKTHCFVTFKTTMTVLNSTQFDTLIPTEIPVPKIHYNVNLLQTIGGENLPLCDRGANSFIKGNDIRVLYYNSDGRRISIGIAGDHQLTGARLYTAVSIVKPQG